MLFKVTHPICLLKIFGRTFEPVLEIILLLPTFKKKKSGVFEERLRLSVGMKMKICNYGSKQFWFCIVIVIKSFKA